VNSTKDGQFFRQLEVIDMSVTDENTKTTLSAVFGGAIPGNYRFDIRHSEYGLIDTSSLEDFNVSNETKVTEITPNSGSIYGGTLLTVKGSNLDLVNSILIDVGAGSTAVPCLRVETE